MYTTVVVRSAVTSPDSSRSLKYQHTEEPDGKKQKHSTPHSQFKLMGFGI